MPVNLLYGHGALAESVMSGRHTVRKTTSRYCRCVCGAARHCLNPERMLVGPKSVGALTRSVQRSDSKRRRRGVSPKPRPHPVQRAPHSPQRVVDHGAIQTGWRSAYNSSGALGSACKSNSLVTRSGVNGSAHNRSVPGARCSRNTAFQFSSLSATMSLSSLK
jgi:hypothetical protein